MNCAFFCILLSAFVGFKKVQGVCNVKYADSQQAKCCLQLEEQIGWHLGAETCRSFIVVINCVLWIVFYCVLLTEFVG